MESLSHAAPAAQAILTFAIFCVIGGAFGAYPRPNGLLSPEALKTISSQIYWLFTPALMISVFGSKLSLEMLQDTAGVMLWSIIFMVVNGCVGMAVQRAVAVEPHLRASFTLASVFNNSASVPLLLLNGLCKSSQLADDPLAFERATAYIFAFSLPWNLCFWSAGLAFSRSDAIKQGLLLPDGSSRTDEAAAAKKDEDAATSTNSAGPVSLPERPGGSTPDSVDARSRDLEHGSLSRGDDDSDLKVVASHGNALARSSTVFSSLCQSGASVYLMHALETAKKSFLTPPVVAIFMGMGIGLWGGLRKAMFQRGGWLQPLGDVVNLLGQPSIPLSNLILAGSLFHGIRDLLRRRAAQKMAAAAALAATQPAPAHEFAAAHLHPDDSDTVPIVTDTGSGISLGRKQSGIMRSISRRLSSGLSVSGDARPPSVRPAEGTVISTPAGPVTLILPLQGSDACHAPPHGDTGGMLVVDAHMHSHEPFERSRAVSNATSYDSSAAATARRTASFVVDLSRRLQRGESFSVVTLGPTSAPQPTGHAGSVAGVAATTMVVLGAPLGPDAVGPGASHALPRLGSMSSGQSSFISPSSAGAGVTSAGPPSGRSSDGSGSGNNSAIERTLSGSSRVSSFRTHSFTVARNATRPLSMGAAAVVAAAAANPGGINRQRSRVMSNSGRTSRASSGGWTHYDVDDDADASQRADLAPDAALAPSLGLRRAVPRLGTLSALREVPSIVDLEKAADGEMDTDVPLGMTPVPKLPGDDDYASSSEDEGGPSGRRGRDGLDVWRSGALGPLRGQDIAAAIAQSHRADVSGPQARAAAHSMSRRPSESTGSAWVQTGDVARRELLEEGGDANEAELVNVAEEEKHRAAAEAAANTLLTAIASAFVDETVPPPQEQPVSVRTGAALILTRLVLSPAILFVLFVVAEALHIPVLAPGRGAQDDVLRLVVLVEAAVPSAQSVLLLCQTVGNVRAAKDVSLIFVFMYPLSLISLTVFLTAAINIVFAA